MRWWPKSLAGQLTLFVLVALVVAQVLVFMMFAHERATLIRDVYRSNTINRVVAVAELLRETAPERRRTLLRVASSRGVRYKLQPAPIIEKASNTQAATALAARIAEPLGLTAGDVQIAVRIKDRSPRWLNRYRHDKRDDDDDGDHRNRHRERRWLAIAIPMADGQWLNVLTGPPPAPPPFGRAFFLSLTLSGLAVGLVAFFIARRIARPLRDLAAGAERLGRGDATVKLEETGPQEARRMTRAFNDMRGRIDRFIRDRTKMLAAISHDLRTPITALRLRAELVDDAETRDKLVDSIDELQTMTEAALAFAKADAASVPPKPVDLNALVDSLIDDLAAMGKSVTFAAAASAARRIVLARTIDLKRALRNLIDNAVDYGGGAEIAISANGDDITIAVIDHGPGIDPDQRDAMFEPFTRGETSRNRDTGGAGLGLAIARDIINAHGGQLVLSTTPGGGLTATVHLPSAPPQRQTENG